jgi:mannitol/fructose-specific phosphotransferase system IIA component (Ntr-type)
MMSLLEAVQAGRLIELPDNDKTHALQILASLIEAIPEMQSGTDVVGKVAERERSMNTGIGLGWACPHARITQEGDMLCAVGWTPTGIDYGSSDGKKVHLVVMYLIPENQKNAYLKEISTLARMVSANGALQTFDTFTDLNEVRNHLLDIITVAIESPAYQAKARMIRLETKQPAVQPAPALYPWMPSAIIPFSAIVNTGRTPLILCQDESLVKKLEEYTNLVNDLTQQTQFSAEGYRIIVRSATPYKPNRTLWDCLAMKEPQQPTASPATPVK